MANSGLVFATLAAAIHVYIFVLESFLWTQPKTMAAFGISSTKDAETLRPMAYNQGFYNAFLAIVTIVGIGLYLAGHHNVGSALVVAGTGSMAAAGLVLLTSSPDKARAAMIQLIPASLAVIFTVIGLV